MFCTNCGRPLADGTKFCTNCGERVILSPVEPAVSGAPEPAFVPVPAPVPEPEPAPEPESVPVPAPAPAPEPAFVPVPVPEPAPEPDAPRCAFCGDPLEPGTRFCTNCGQPVSGQPARSQTADAPAAYPAGPAAYPLQESDARHGKKNKRKRRGGRVALILIIVFVLLAGAALGGGYLVLRGWHSEAMALLHDMDFAAAEETLKKIPGAKTRYPEAFDLIDAGRLMEDGKFDKAIKAFDKLDDYENAEICRMEATYRKAAQLVREGSFDEALQLYRALDDYRDAAEQVISVQIAQANALIAAGSDAEAMQLLKTLAANGSEEAVRKIAQLEQTLYEKASVAYRDGALDEAETLFALLADYERSADFLTLISARRSIEAEPTSEECKALLWDTLAPRIGFEDAGELILSSTEMTYLFLTGDWQNADNSRHFNMHPLAEEGRYTVNYNFPWFAQDGTFALEPGGLYTETDSSNRTYDTLRFTIVARDMVLVYDFKDGTTETLTRK